MRNMLYYFFLSDVVDQLEPKYQEIVAPFTDKRFLYANFLEIPAFYKVFSYKKNRDYHLMDKLHHLKHYETIALFEKEIQEKNYRGDFVLLLYAYVSHQILDHYLESYLESMIAQPLNIPLTKRQHMKRYSSYSNGIEAQFFEERMRQRISKCHPYKEFKDSLWFGDDEKKLIHKLFSDIYFFSYGETFFDISFQKYTYYLKHFVDDPIGIKKLYLKIGDTFTRTKKYSAASFSKFNIFSRKKDYLNYKRRTWKLYDLIEMDLSFNDLYQKALEDTLELLNPINEEIFYQKNKKATLQGLLQKILSE